MRNTIPTWSAPAPSPVRAGTPAARCRSTSAVPLTPPCRVRVAFSGANTRDLWVRFATTRGPRASAARPVRVRDLPARVGLGARQGKVNGCCCLSSVPQPVCVHVRLTGCRPGLYIRLHGAHNDHSREGGCAWCWGRGRPPRSCVWPVTGDPTHFGLASDFLVVRKKETSELGTPQEREGRKKKKGLGGK